MAALLGRLFHKLYSLRGLRLNRSEINSNAWLIECVNLNSFSFCLSLIAHSPARPILAYMPVSMKLATPYSLDATPGGSPTSLAMLMMLSTLETSDSLGQKLTRPSGFVYS